MKKSCRYGPISVDYRQKSLIRFGVGIKKLSTKSRGEKMAMVESWSKLLQSKRNRTGGYKNILWLSCNCKKVLQASHDCIILWSSCNLFVIILWSSHDHLTIISRSSYNHLMIILQASHDHLPSISWVSCNNLMIILQSSCNPIMVITWSSCYHLIIILR